MVSQNNRILKPALQFALARWVVDTAQLQLRLELLDAAGKTCMPVRVPADRLPEVFHGIVSAHVSEAFAERVGSTGERLFSSRLPSGEDHVAGTQAPGAAGFPVVIVLVVFVDDESFNLQRFLARVAPAENLLVEGVLPIELLGPSKLRAGTHVTVLQVFGGVDPIVYHAIGRANDFIDVMVPGGFHHP